MSSVRDTVLDVVRGTAFVVGASAVPLILFDYLRAVLAMAGSGPVA